MTWTCWSTTCACGAWLFPSTLLWVTFLVLSLINAQFLLLVLFCSQCMLKTVLIFRSSLLSFPFRSESSPPSFIEETVRNESTGRHSLDVIRSPLLLVLLSSFVEQHRKQTMFLSMGCLPISWCAAYVVFQSWYLPMHLAATFLR